VDYTEFLAATVHLSRLRRDEHLHRAFRWAPLPDERDRPDLLRGGQESGLEAPGALLGALLVWDHTDVIGGRLGGEIG
jgi:hypothetical protein